MALPQMRWRVKGIFPETGIGAIYGPSKPDQACITFSDAGEAVLETLTGLASNKRRNSAREIVQQLVDRGYLRAGFDEDEEQWIWL